MYWLRNGDTMKHFSNEDGISYVLVMTFLGFGICAFLLIVLSPITATFVNYANSLVGGNLHYPAQAQGTLGFIIAMGALSPVVLIVGTLLGAYLDSVVEKEQAGGGMI
jgi:hypothetical protein